MKNLRQLLRRPVRQCDAETWDEELADGTYAVNVTCTHTKRPRRYQLVGSWAQEETRRREMWERVQRDVDTHLEYSDPW